MVTVFQLFRVKRQPKWKAKRLIALKSCPQRKGHCVKVYKVAPKKPNSARRSVVRVGLTTNFVVTAYIPGEAHNLQKYSCVLIRGGRTPDLPGVRFKVIRGKYDCHSILARKNSRSLYGTKKWIKKPVVKH